MSRSFRGKGDKRWKDKEPIHHKRRTKERQVLHNVFRMNEEEIDEILLPEKKRDICHGDEVFNE